MRGKWTEPSDKDWFVCPHCGKKFKWKSPYCYAPRFIKRGERIQIIDSWNIPYSTGIWILANDDVTKDEIEKYVRDKVHFPFWDVIRKGVLWSKNTWDD